MPAVVSYDIGAGLSVRNTLLLDQKQVYEDPNYENPDSPSSGAIQIQIVTAPTKGSVVLFGSTTFGYTPSPYYSGTDSFTWQALEDGVVLGGVQTIQLTLPPGGYGNPPPPPVGSGLADVTILPYAVSASNSTRTLFLAAGYASEQVSTTIDLTAQVSRYYGSGPAPSGEVIFTATQPDGTAYEIGSATVGADGKATIQVGTQLLPLGTIVEAKYGGDQFFGIKKVGDGGRTATDLKMDVVVNNNPTIDANTVNMTVVVVCGKDSAEQLRFAQEARRYYGNSAYLITSVHSVVDLGNKLAQFPPGSVSKLILTGHGNHPGIKLDGDANGKWFGAAELAGDLQSTQKIKTALLAGGRLEFQSCLAAEKTQAHNGRANMKSVAEALGVYVWGADKLLYCLDYGWNRTGQWTWDSKVTWYRSDPNPAVVTDAVAQN